MQLNDLTIAGRAETRAPLSAFGVYWREAGKAEKANPSAKELCACESRS